VAAASAVQALERLDPAQRAAARHGAGPLLVIAGAGTGKTGTLAHRVAAFRALPGPGRWRACASDEDYLVLSTVHSAKGQEWESVHILNVADGSLPSEFSAGKPGLIEEARRLLYVAMTRAKTELHLIAPLKYYVTQQPRLGDRHVYGARSRFITDRVMKCFESTSWPQRDPEAKNHASEPLATDISARLRGMWT
jgi:superfamily I DNA/RNA helicase